jgi:hypothetical protein
MPAQTFLIRALAILSTWSIAGPCTNSPLALQQACPRTYQAPIEACGDASVIPDSYVIWLFPDVSMEEHSGAVGRDMRIFRRSQIFDDEDGIVYTVQNLDDDVLNAVRADRGVQLVECDQYLIF